MKKYIILASSVLVFAFAVTAFAEDNDDTSTRPRSVLFPKAEIADLRAEIEFEKDGIKGLRASTSARVIIASTTRADVRSEIEDRKQNIKDDREEIKNKILESVRERVENINNIITGRFNGVMERALKIDNRIVSRIEKIKAAGKDTTETTTLLAAARAKAAIAKDKIAAVQIAADAVKVSIQASIALSASSTNASSTKEISAEAKASVKAAMAAAKTAVKETYDAYKKVVESLKKIDIEVSATTTANVQ